MNEIKITPEEIGKAAELIRKVAREQTQPAEPLTSWEIAKIFPEYAHENFQSDFSVLQCRSVRRRKEGVRDCVQTV